MSILVAKLFSSYRNESIAMARELAEYKVLIFPVAEPFAVGKQKLSGTENRHRNKILVIHVVFAN